MLVEHVDTQIIVHLHIYQAQSRLSISLGSYYSYFCEQTNRQMKEFEKMIYNFMCIIW